MADRCTPVRCFHSVNKCGHKTGMQRIGTLSTGNMCSVLFLIANSFHQTYWVCLVLKLSSLALPPWPRGPTRIPVKLDHLEEVKVYVCHRIRDGSLHGLDSLVQPALLDGVGIEFFIQVHADREWVLDS